MRGAGKERREDGYHVHVRDASKRQLTGRVGGPPLPSSS